jgi:hypothetical protein
MADRVEDQTIKTESDSLRATASGRSFADAFSDQESKATADLGSPDNSTILTTRITSDKPATPTKLPADGLKPEPDTASKGLQKVAPDNAGIAPRETQAARDTVTPASHPGDKASASAANPGANPRVNPEVTPKVW